LTATGPESPTLDYSAAVLLTFFFGSSTDLSLLITEAETEANGES
jgi:hypothetical protein